VTDYESNDCNSKVHGCGTVLSKHGTIIMNAVLVGNMRVLERAFKDGIQHAYMS
jgi:hypothetical protein